ncbi:MAG: hypothetical protein RI909_1143 [Bacteroidota bacterium]
MKQIIALAVVVGLVFIQSCGSDDATCTKVVPAENLASVDQAKLASDIIAIDTYLQNNGIVAQSEPNGVRYVVTTQGSGTKPCLENTIKVKYSGTLLKTGTVFNATSPEVSFKLSGLILGWQLVLPLIQAGSKVTLYIPSGLGYGVAGGANGAIPSNANLIFEIEFISIN